MADDVELVSMAMDRIDQLARVSRIEAGQINVTLETVEQIATALQTVAADLLKPTGAENGAP